MTGLRVILLAGGLLAGTGGYDQANDAISYALGFGSGDCAEVSGGGWIDALKGITLSAAGSVYGGLVHRCVGADCPDELRQSIQSEEIALIKECAGSDITWSAACGTYVAQCRAAEWTHCMACYAAWLGAKCNGLRSKVKGLPKEKAEEQYDDETKAWMSFVEGLEKEGGVERPDVLQDLWDDVVDAAIPCDEVEQEARAAFGDL